MFRAYRGWLGRGSCLNSAGERCYLGQSKIENLGVAPVSNENIRRLDIAVEDSLSVRGIECIRYLDSECD